MTELLRDIAIRILALAEEKGALLRGDFTLSSGIKSKYYFDGRRLTLDPEGAMLSGKAFNRLLQETDVVAVGGPTLAADPIVTAVSLISYIEGRLISGFIVRKESKEHGTQKLIEGPLMRKSRVAIVDDTCTTGGSLLMAIKAVEKMDCTVEKVCVILDRDGNGRELFARRGYPFEALLETTKDGEIKIVAPNT
jgi:orotate phosphoribosyltransferase